MDYTRNSWTGRPRALSNPWSLTKDERSAYCFIVAHPEGAEIRVEVDGDLRRKHVCGTVDAALKLAAEWREQMLQHGWTPIQPLPGRGTA
jgi:hypothetical protein